VLGGFFAADVLFARGEGEAEGRVTGEIEGLADETAGELANVLFAGGDDADIGTAVAGDSEALQFTDDDSGFAEGSRNPRGTASVKATTRSARLLWREVRNSPRDDGVHGDGAIVVVRRRRRGGWHSR